MRLPRLRLLTLLTSVLIAGSFASTALAEQRIAVVDTQRAIMETEEGLRAQATLRKLFDSKQRELDKKQEDLQKQREDIEKQRSVLSAEAWQKRVESWQRDMTQLQATFVEYNKDLQKKQGELTQPIFQRAMGVIRRLATSEGYDLVVDKQAVPYARGDLDLTDKVIQMVNGGSAPTAEGATTSEAKKPATQSNKSAKPVQPAVPAAPATKP